MGERRGAMLTNLTVMEKVVGAKQAKRALRDGKAKRVYLAEDADPRVTDPIAELCAKDGVPTGHSAKRQSRLCACMLQCKRRKRFLRF